MRAFFVKHCAAIVSVAIVIMILATCLFADYGRAQSDWWPDYQGDLRAVPGVAGGGSIPGGVIYCEPPISDTLPMICYLQGADAWEQATGANRTGGNLSVCPGSGTKQYIIDDFSLCAGDNVTLNIDGFSTTFTEGAQWNRGASNNAACISLAAGIEASGAGPWVAATCPGGGATVYITFDPRICWVDLTESDVTCTSLIEGTDGQILSGRGSLGAPTYSFAGYPTLGMYSYSGTTIGFAFNNVLEMSIGSSIMQLLTNDLDIRGGKVYNSNVALSLGTLGVTGHALTAGDVLVGGKLEIDGVSYFDGQIFIYGATTMSTVSTGIYPYATANGFSLFLNRADQTPDTGLIATGSLGNSILIGEYADLGTDYAFPLQANPTLAIQSSDSGTTTDTLYFQHNQTDGVIATRGGMLDLNPATAAVMLPSVIAAVPAEPTACAAAAEGATVYVDDTNDTAYGQVCICSNKDGTGYDWRLMSDIVGTACPFF